jgi:predicted O-linked N-acetylglucosamine transferase (SPINDLY family)
MNGSQEEGLQEDHQEDCVEEEISSSPRRKVNETAPARLPGLFLRDAELPATAAQAKMELSTKGASFVQQMTLEEALGLAAGHHRAGNYPLAESIYRQILAQEPRHPRATFGLGGLAVAGGRFEDGLSLVQRAISLDPGDPQFYAAQGNILMMLDRQHEAIAAFVKALSIRPDLAEAHFQVGNASILTGQSAQALVAYRQAIRIRPDYQDAHCNLCHTLIDMGDLDAAVEAANQALVRWPTFAMLHRHLGRAHREAGRLDEAVEAQRAGLERVPDPQLHSDLLFTLNFHPGYDRRRLLEEHREWERRYATPYAGARVEHANDLSSDRRLRVGYVAHDLGNHPLGRFMLPILLHHNRQNVEVFVYCELLRTSETGKRLKEAADVWRPLRGMSDEQVAAQIREDRIDVLVDITMHSNGCRLAVFARKPAPVQVTYLAYCGTTGVSAVDYRLTDPYLDPPGPSKDLGEGPLDRDAYYAEKSVGLPVCYWCYPQPGEAPEVGELPAQKNGYVTFGCLNEFAKVGPGVLDAWCEVLRRVEKSKLLMHAKFGGHRERVIGHLKGRGIDPVRVDFVNHVPMHEYFPLYHRIDVALDPFPWAGGTTTFDALWMGVPVVTLAGDTGVSRGGLSIVSNLGKPEWAATSVEEYARVAQGLAEDLPELARIRGEMREKMRASTLMDARRFVAGLEGAYREMWRTYCGQKRS